MNQIIYNWSWKRANKKHFLVLTKDGKKIASVRDYLFTPQCSCGPDHNCYGPTREELEDHYGPGYHAYVGGKKIGQFLTSTEAKIAVEKYLNISTKKQKKNQPKLSYTKGGSVYGAKIRRYIHQNGMSLAIKEFGFREVEKHWEKP
jgi:hypothetical protein